MRTMRRWLSCVLGIWLLLQVAGIVAPVAIAAAGFMTAEELCDCPADGHGATCPMHHGKPGQSLPKDDGSCRLQNMCAASDATMLSMLGGAGILPSAAADVFEFTSAPIPSIFFAEVRRVELPDAPPPRA